MPSTSSSTMTNINNPELGLTSLSLLPRHIPTLGYTVQNILISLAALVFSTASLLFTLLLILPLSMLRAFTPRCMLMPAQNKRTPRKKVILIVGASRGMGFGVLKQYVDDPNAVIIAPSQSIDIMHKSIGIIPILARLECAEVDLAAPKKQLARALQSIDNEHGPITHLYAVSGVSNHVNGKDATGVKLDVMAEIINANISGTVACIITMYEMMKTRGHGKICISIPALSTHTNMISYASAKSFIYAFSTSLRVLAAPWGVEVVTAEPGFLDLRTSKSMRGQNQNSDCTPDAERIARRMKSAVEGGGVGVVCWPAKQGVVMHGLEAINPICEEVGKWISMQVSMQKRVDKGS